MSSTPSSVYLDRLKVDVDRCKRATSRGGTVSGIYLAEGSVPWARTLGHWPDDYDDGRARRLQSSTGRARALRPRENARFG